MVSFYELAEKALALERSGKKMIRLNVGDTNLPTPQCIIDAATDSLKKDKAKYVAAAGIAELKEQIAKREKCEIENIIIGPGSKHLIFGLMSVLLKRGEKVLLPAPTWAAYELICKQLGLEAKIVASKLEENWSPQKLDIADAKMAVICNPLNPTSTVFNDKIIKEMIENAQSKGAHIILDEAYKGLAFKEIPRYDGAIRIRSFSKEFSMEGWRLGYAVAPAEVVKKLVKFTQITSTCTPPFIQHGGIAALMNEKKILSDALTIWKKRADVATTALEKAGFEFAKPTAGIYAFATHKNLGDADEYALRLLEQGIAIAPGRGFGGFNKFIRICLNQKEEMLEEAIEKMGKAL